MVTLMRDIVGFFGNLVTEAGELWDHLQNTDPGNRVFCEETTTFDSDLTYQKMVVHRCRKCTNIIQVRRGWRAMRAMEG